MSAFIHVMESKSK